MINFSQYLSGKQEERIYIDSLMREQQEQDNITNWIVDENEDGEEILVAKYVYESKEDPDEEPEEESEEEKKKKVSKADLTGKLHELLVGYHLNGGKHMEKHPNIEGDSPEEAHDKLKDTLEKNHPGEYARTAARAKSAASDIKQHFDGKGHVIKHVVWTSKSGDIGRATGGKFNSSQNEDPSDIVVHSHHKDDEKKHTKFTGISLKKTDKNSPEVPLANPGIEHSGPNAKGNLIAHRKSVVDAHPTMPTTYTNSKGKVKVHGAEKRKDWLKAQPEEVKADIKRKNTTVLHKTAKDLADHLNREDSTHEERQAKLVHLLSAKNPPMHNQPIYPGSTDTHEHYRHVTYGSGDNIKHHLITDVEKHYENHTSEPEKLHIEARGGSVVFSKKEKDKDGNDTHREIARQDMKFSSQSDPQSSMVSSGKEIKIKTPRAKKDPDAPKKPRAKKDPNAPKKTRAKKKVANPVTPIPTANQSSLNLEQTRNRRLTTEQVRYITTLIRENVNA